MNKRNPARSKLLGYIVGEQGQLEITQSIEELTQVAHKFHQNNIEILAINGGDGTISKTLTAFIRAYQNKPLPKVALLRGGTMNVLAQNLAVKGGPEALLYRLVEAYSRNHVFKIQMLRSLRVDNHYGFLFADGVAVNFLEEFYKNKSGYWGVFKLFCKLFYSILRKGPLAQSVITDQMVTLDNAYFKSHSHLSCGIFASTIARMPLGLRLFPHVRTNPNVFEFFSANVNHERLLYNLVPIMLRRPLNGKSMGKLAYCCDYLKIKAQSPNYKYSLDGELYQLEKPELSIELGPKIDFVLI